MVTTTEQQITKPGSMAVVHRVKHLFWEREWHESPETSRAHLLDRVTTLLEMLNADPHLSGHILLGGQVIVLEELAAVRPDLLKLLAEYNAAGRLEIGSWYSYVDESLVSGEALIRNLLVAQDIARQYNIDLMKMGFAPTSPGHTAHLPQILRGFGINAVLVWRGAPYPRVPFCWEAPDGSHVLAINYPFTSCYDDTEYRHTNRHMKSQQIAEPDGPWLWLQSVIPCESTQDILESDGEQEIDTQTIESSLIDHIHALRQHLPDEFRPTVRGELRIQTNREHDYLLSGTLAVRSYLKQANHDLQSRLTYAVEPWLALALTHGDVSSPANLTALLQHSWRTLLKNQAFGALGGCSVDTVHQESEVRFQQVTDNSAYLIDEALNALPGKPRSKVIDTQDKIYVVVWNPHNWPVEQVVEVRIQLASDQHPQRLLDPDGDETLFGWQGSTSVEEAYRGFQVGVLSFLAKAPSVGYATYTLQTSQQLPGSLHRVRSEGGQAIVSTFRDTLTVEDSHLLWHRDDDEIVDVLRFFDGGDAGDAFNYSPPQSDTIVKADLVESEIKVESAALYERLIIPHRLRVAPSLDGSRNRNRGLKLLELSTSATFYHGMPGIYFETAFENTAKDHRLRAHLRTGILADRIVADSAFGFVSRQASSGSGSASSRPGPNTETMTHTYPAQSMSAVENGQIGMALCARGLQEFQAISEHGQITFGLTMLRAVGWLSRHDLRTRTAQIAPGLAIPDAQSQRMIHAAYAMIPLVTNGEAPLARITEMYKAPLQAYQYQEAPQKPVHSYLSIDGDGIVMTALKPPQSGEGIIVRLFNPLDKQIRAKLSLRKTVVGVAILNMAEQTQYDLPYGESGPVEINIEPQKIITILLKFA